MEFPDTYETVEKIKQISGINFDDADEVLAVSNGLIIYKMLKEIE